MRETFTNEQLVLMIKEGKKEYINDLFERNKSGVNKVAFDFYKRNIGTITSFGSYSYEDILQMANIYFIESVEKYDPDKGVKYITFLMNYVRWLLNTIFFRNGKVKAKLRSEFNKACIIEELDEVDDDCKSGNNTMPSHTVDFNSRLIIDEALSTLPKVEEREMIKDLYLNGYTYQELVIKYKTKNEATARAKIYRIMKNIRENIKISEENFIGKK